MVAAPISVACCCGGATWGLATFTGGAAAAPQRTLPKMVVANCRLGNRLGVPGRNVELLLGRRRVAAVPPAAAERLEQRGGVAQTRLAWAWTNWITACS